MLNVHVDFLIENIILEHQNAYLNDIVRLCVLQYSCSPGCYLAKGFDLTQKRMYITLDIAILVSKG